MPSPTRKRKRSASRSPSRRIKNIDKILEAYYTHILRNPTNRSAVERGNRFMHESYPMLDALRKNGRNNIQKIINRNQNAQGTLKKMRHIQHKFKKHPKTAIGETPANLTPISRSPIGISHTKYLSMFPDQLVPSVPKLKGL